MRRILLKCIGEEDSGKKLLQVHLLLPWQPRFGRNVYSKFLLFKYFSPLINELFKESANSLSQSQLINIFINIFHVTCDVIGIMQYLFEIQDGGHVLCTASKFKAFRNQFAFDNVSNRTKKVLVILTALNTRNLSKILLLLFMA